MSRPSDKQILFEVADGPEGVTIYSSEDEAISSWGRHVPGVFVSVSVNGAMAHFGPFSLIKPEDIGRALEEF